MSNSTGVDLHGMGTTIVPEAYPEEIRYPKELPPEYRGNVDAFLVWKSQFEEYCNLRTIAHIFGNKLDIDTKRPFDAFVRARRNGVAVDDFKRTMIARWVLVKASKDPKFRTIFDNEGVPFKTFDAIFELFRQDSAMRMSVLSKRVRSERCGFDENLCDVLCRMED